MKSARDGGPELDLVGGRVCLDFANHRERLLEGDDPYAGLIELSIASGLLESPEADVLLRSADGRPGERDAVIRRGGELAAALTGLFRSVVAGGAGPAAELRVVNREIARANANAEIVQDSGTLLWSWRDATPPALDRPLWPVARDAADLLTATDTGRIRICASDPCRWLFLDTSRNGRRRWCDMASCGNRAKARRFRERRQASEGTPA